MGVRKCWATYLKTSAAPLILGLFWRKCMEMCCHSKSLLNYFFSFQEEPSSCQNSKQLWQSSSMFLKNTLERRATSISWTRQKWKSCFRMNWENCWGWVTFKLSQCLLTNRIVSHHKCYPLTESQWQGSNRPNLPRAGCKQRQQRWLFRVWPSGLLPRHYLPRIRLQKVGIQAPPWGWCGELPSCERYDVVREKRTCTVHFSYTNLYVFTYKIKLTCLDWCSLCVSTWLGGIYDVMVAQIWQLQKLTIFVLSTESCLVCEAKALKPWISSYCSIKNNVTAGYSSSRCCIYWSKIRAGWNETH